MTSKRFRALLGAGCMAVACGGAAHAGGFSRGTADTDIIFDAGNFDMRASVAYVSPKRKFSKVPANASGLLDTSYTDGYAVPSLALKLNIVDNVRCAVTMVDNNGGSATYAVPKPSGKLTEDFSTNEKALTCGVKFDVGRGSLWLLGGGFMETFSYARTNYYGAMLGYADLDLDGEEFGYRVGAAYEIPDIALRAQVMYRSGTEYGANGTLTAPVGVLAAATAHTNPQASAKFAALAQLYGPAYQYALPAIGVGDLPPSVEMKVQSGIAPGWLAFGSVKWTQWSVLKALDVRARDGGTPITSDVYKWKDGWTVTGGVGHAFSDRVSGLVSLTWDSGVANGYDFASDTYTLAFGGSLKDGLGGELRAGLGVSYLSAATVTKGVDTGFAVKAGYALAGSVGYNIKF